MTSALGGFATAAHAQTTQYTSQSSFLAAVKPGYYNELFKGTNAAANTTVSVSFSGNGFAYTVMAAPIGTTTKQTYWAQRKGLIGSVSPNDSVTITFTSNNVTALGGNFFLSDTSDAFTVNPVTLTLDNGTTVSYTPSTLAASYYGFTTSAPIQSITMAAYPKDLLYNSLQNLTVGSAAVGSAAAPEPDACALLMAGSILLIRVCQRRRKTRLPTTP